MSASRIATRPSNKEAHPGLIAFDSETEELPIPKRRKARRTPAQMKEDRALAAANKESKQLQAEDAIKKVAQLESTMAAADEENRQNAARPAQSLSTSVKVARKRTIVCSDDEQDIGMYHSIFISSSS